MRGNLPILDASAGTVDIDRFRGTVVWIQLVTGERVDAGTVDRAIRRDTEFVMDLRSGLGEYAVTLHSGEDGKLRGTWERDRGAERGTLDGQLTSHSDDPTKVMLLGSWGPGTVIWGCVLERIQSF